MIIMEDNLLQPIPEEAEVELDKVLMQRYRLKNMAYIQKNKADTVLRCTSPIF